MVAGTNITKSAAKIAVNEDKNGIFDTYINADWPKPLTMTSESDAIRNVIESLSPTLRKPITIPKITKNA